MSALIADDRKLYCLDCLLPLMSAIYIAASVGYYDSYQMPLMSGIAADVASIADVDAPL
jgi:hypothetical protein